MNNFNAMKIRKSVFLIILFLGFLSNDEIKASNANYSHTIMEDMIKKAGEEGKMILLEFYADWCAPCKWMQETVFQDQEIKSLLSNSYITKLVNIDDIDGFELKNLYEVQVLPTILIFNTTGKMIERIEKTIATSELISVLGLHDNHRNKVKIKHSINSSPTPNIASTTDSKNIQETHLRYIESNNKTVRNYRLQMGIYEDFENAFNKVNNLKDTFLEPIIVVNDYKNKIVRYKVMMGEFSTLSEAESFRKILNKEFKLDAIIN
jgi:thioredoxin-related protein